MKRGYTALVTLFIISLSITYAAKTTLTTTENTEPTAHADLKNGVIHVNATSLHGVKRIQVFDTSEGDKKRIGEWKTDPQQNPAAITLTLNNMNATTVMVQVEDTLNQTTAYETTPPRPRKAAITLQTQGDGETTPPAGCYTLNMDENLTIYATPLDGATFIHWTLDGAAVSTEPSLTVKPLNATVTAVFTEAAPCIPNMTLLPGVAAGPTPGLDAPEGKVKFTLVHMPPDTPGVSTMPPPGVYFADAGTLLELSCESLNPEWVFKEWIIGKGIHGMTVSAGAGDLHLFNVTLDMDTVVIARHSQTIN